MIFRSTFIVKLKGKNLLGFTQGPIGFVRNDAEQHTVEHEKTHIRQWWRHFGFLVFPLFFKKGYRYKMELEAYIVSVKNGRDINSAARALSTHNGGNVHAALTDIQKGL